MGFGTYIRQKRDAKGIALNDFSRQLEISPAYWSRIEREMEKSPKDELIRKAAEILGENPDDAFIEAGRLPPDMREDVGEIVRMVRNGPRTVMRPETGVPATSQKRIAESSPPVHASVEELSSVPLNIVRGQKGFEALAAVFREQILKGEIQAGEILPNERDLVERSGLSRGSVREAFRVLETQGLVSTRLGRNGGRVALQSGTEAVANSLNFFIRGQQVPFAVLMETVKVLEPSLAELAAIHRDADDIAILQNESKKLRTTSNASRFLAANARWHRAMAHASHNPILTTIYDALGPGLLNPHVAGFASAEVRDAVVQAVGRIEEAIVAGDSAAARRRMDRHVLAYRAQLERLAPPSVTL
ncbi:MAG: FCD domain-containing protein [Pseudomonadota bacterium]